MRLPFIIQVTGAPFLYFSESSSSLNYYSGDGVAFCPLWDFFVGLTIKSCRFLSCSLSRSLFSLCVLSHSVMSDSLRLHDYSPPGSSVHGDSPGKNPGVGCHALPQGIFPTQRLNPGLPYYRWILYWLRCFWDDVLSCRELLTPSDLFRYLNCITMF